MDKLPKGFVKVTYEVANKVFTTLGDGRSLRDPKTNACAVKYQVVQDRGHLELNRYMTWLPDGHILHYWSGFVSATDVAPSTFYVHKDTLAEVFDEVLSKGRSS